MFIHPDLLSSVHEQHHRDLIEQADRYRLLAVARRRGRARGAGGAVSVGRTPVVRGRPAGNLAACEPPAAASAR
ncbi:hypothetical protein GCM10023322_60430 [Rugosimonospora acidiphila]|uniref:Uncharacterized protein n=1 Tax=Rugosimonospora acidiphila TaxID=556531 RepID=A0ABP9SHP9_9ACTN